MKRDQNYRYNLKPMIGNNIALECRDFMITKNKLNGRTFVLMNAPTIVKGKGLHKSAKRRIGHLWCEIDTHEAEYLKLAKAIRVVGRVHEYQKQSEETQVGVRAYSVEILEYAKDICTRYRGEKLPNYKLDEILEERRPQ